MLWNADSSLVFFQLGWLVKIVFSHWPLGLASEVSTSALASPLTQSAFFRHALSSPISSLTLNLDLCLAHLENQSQEQSKLFLTQALLNAKHVQQLVQLSQARVRPPTTTFLLKPALHEVVTRLHQPWLHQEIVSYLNISPAVELKGPAFYLQEALSCLINNAFESYGNQRQRSVSLTCYQHQKVVVIHISDIGTGMNWLTRRLFDQPGFSSKRQNQGVGLTFVKQIIKSHYNGQLSIRTAKGSGTTVTLLLPIKSKINHVAKPADSFDHALLLAQSHS